MKISMIGSGRWGTFITWYLDSIGHTVKLYGPADTPHMQALLATRSNGTVTLPESVELVCDIHALADADVIGISVPSQALHGLMGELRDANLTDKKFVLCMKGIDIKSGKRLSEIASEGAGHDRVAVWIGPGHPQEFCRGIPNCMVIDSANEALKRELVEAFSSKLIRFYYGSDLIGNEVGAAAKNVGGNELSAYGLCHLGDYEATVFSKYSHNRQFGESYVKGEAYTDLAEGYYTVKAMMKLADRYKVDLPISAAVYAVLYEGVPPKTAIDALFERSLKEEFV